MRAAALRTQLSGLAARPARLLLTGLSIVVAAFVVYAAVLAQQVAERSTLDGLSRTTAATAAVVLPADGKTLTDSDIEAIRRVPGVGEVEPRTDGAVGMEISGAGVARAEMFLAGEPGTGPLARLTVDAGHYPTKPGEIAINPQAAEAYRLSPGSQIKITVGDKGRKTPAVVTGIVSGGTWHDAGAYVPASWVNKLTGAPGYNRLDVGAAPGASAGDVIAGVEQALGGRGTATPGSAVRAEEAETALADLKEVFALIAMFLAIAAVAAAMVASSTFRILFAQRQRQLALLRAIGAMRGQLTRALTIEGAVVGLVAGTIGVGLATLAGVALPVVTSLARPDLRIGPALAIIAGAALVTTGAVLAPARAATAVSPLQAIRNAAVSVATGRLGLLRLGVSLICAFGAAALAALLVVDLPEPGKQENLGGSLLLVVLSAGLAFLALIGLGPALVRAVLSVAGRPLRRLGPIGSLAVGGVGNAPRRAAAVSVVVALGVSLVAGALVGLSSLHGYIDQQVAAKAPADFVIRSVSPGLAGKVEALKQVKDVTPFREVDAAVGSSVYQAADLRLDALATLRGITAAHGDLADLKPGSIVVSRETADGIGAGVGAAVDMKIGGRPARLTVAAILPSHAPMNASFLVTPQDLDRLGVPAAPTTLLANPAQGGLAARKAADEALRKTVGDGKANVTDLAKERDEGYATLDLIASIPLGMLTLTVLISVVGIGTTTAMTVVERARESGLLRALGLNRAGLRRLVTLEAGLYGFLGGVLGLVLGVPYAWLSVSVLGIGAPLRLPAGQLSAVFAGMILIATVAGLIPARRASRVSPIEALGAID